MWINPQTIDFRGASCEITRAIKDHKSGSFSLASESSFPVIRRERYPLAFPLPFPHCTMQREMSIDLRVAEVASGIALSDESLEKKEKKKDERNEPKSESAGSHFEGKKKSARSERVQRRCRSG